jgi:hypothetical protein
MRTGVLAALTVNQNNTYVKPAGTVIPVKVTTWIRKIHHSNTVQSDIQHNTWCRSACC